jgi:GTP-binding protein
MEQNKTPLLEREVKPLVAIVGRPNVGKSTLFNRVSGMRSAIVSPIPGTTRDRVTNDAVWGDYPFILVDTGGLELSSETLLWHKVRDQINTAITEADVIIMLVDADEGVTAPDRDVADLLRRTTKPVVLAANKADNDMREAEAVEFYELGLGDPLPVSAYHNRGIDDLMARVVAHFPAEPPGPAQDADLRLAIVGRTNVGKSMLLNAIAGQDRAIVSEVPGTTRDAIDTVITHDQKSVLLIDTAGIRRRGSIQPGIERYSALRAIRAIDRAQVVVLVMDASELATSQDSHIAGYVTNAYRGIVLAVNKWDLASELGLGKDEAAAKIRERFKFAPHAPICFISALQGTGTDTLLETAQVVYGSWSKEVPRYDLRRTILDAVARHPPPSSGRGAVKIYGVKQDQAGPPTFTFYVNRSNMAHITYQRYLQNTLRKQYGFDGCSLRMRFKARGEK